MSIAVIALGIVDPGMILPPIIVRSLEFSSGYDLVLLTISQDLTFLTCSAQVSIKPRNLDSSGGNRSVFDYHLQFIILYCHEKMIMLDWSIDCLVALQC